MHVRWHLAIHGFTTPYMEDGKQILNNFHQSKLQCRPMAAAEKGKGSGFLNYVFYLAPLSSLAINAEALIQCILSVCYKQKNHTYSRSPLHPEMSWCFNAITQFPKEKYYHTYTSSQHYPTPTFIKSSQARFWVSRLGSKCFILIWTFNPHPQNDQQLL